MVMDAISEEDRCSCTPKTMVNGKEYPPKMGEGVKADSAKVGIAYGD